jgi:hypothetical protein
MAATAVTTSVIAVAGESTVAEMATSRPPMSVSILRRSRHARVRLDVAIFPSKLRQ